MQLIDKQTLMFQSFDSPEPAQSSLERLKKMRALLAQHKLAAFLIPRADEHQGEYVPPSVERLRWFTGFSGSAGQP